MIRTRVFKNFALRTLDWAPIRRVVSTIAASKVTIFVLHRFVDESSRWAGTSAGDLRKVLDTLKKLKVSLVSLDDIVVGNLDLTDTRRPIVAFTIDDGYSDMLDIGHKIFSDFDCPYTGFVVPEAIDSDLWFWWDRVDYVFRHTAHRSCTLPASLDGHYVAWDSVEERSAVQLSLCERIKLTDWSKVEEAIGDLADTLGVTIPSKRPSEYSIASWDALRRAERDGAQFGAHTMTHPILRRCSDHQAKIEIVDSLRRVREELLKPSNVFCYPNGRLIDFGNREMELLESNKLDAAVTTVSGSLTTSGLVEALSDRRRWTLPRKSLDCRSGAVVRDVYFRMESAAR